MATTVTTDAGLTPAQVNAFYDRKALTALRDRLLVTKQFPTAKIPAHNSTTIKFYKPTKITGVQDLVEGVTPPATTFAYTQITEQVKQKGGYKEISDILQMTTLPNNIVADIATELGKEAAEQIEKEVINKLATTTSIAFANPAHLTIATVTSADILTPACVTRIRTILSRNNAKTFSDGFYRMFITPEQLADLQESQDWKDHAIVNDPKDIERGIVGKFRGFKFFETNLLPQQQNATNVQIQTAIAVGDAAVKTVDIADYDINKPKVIINDKPDKSDPLAQRIQVGVKCMFGCALLEPLSVVAVYTSASTL